MVVVYLIFEKMLGMFLLFLYIYLLINILLFRMLIVGIYFEINGIPMILYLISVIWNICLNGLFKILLCSIVLVGRRNNWIFP